MNFSEKQMNPNFQIGDYVEYQGLTWQVTAIQGSYAVIERYTGNMREEQRLRLSLVKPIDWMKKGARHNPGKYRVLVKQYGSPAREMIAVHGQDYQWYDLDGSPLETGGAYVQEMLEEMEQNPVEKLIKVSYETITPESAEEGDIANRGWIDEDGEDMVPDEYDEEEGITAVDKAVEFLRDEGASEPSASRFREGVWYTAYGEQDPFSGEVENKSYHLHGFTEDEQRKIFEAMTSRRNPAGPRENPMRLTVRDKKVIAAFLRQEQDSSKKLISLGHRLDGNWMGGRNIASWEGERVVFHDLGSRAAESVQRYIETKIGKQNPSSSSPPAGWHWPSAAYDRHHKAQTEWRRYQDTLPHRGVFADKIENPSSSDIDHHAATELKIYIDNDAQLYRQHKQPIELNLSKKWKKGTYDEALAAKAYMYLVDDGAKKYVKEFGGTWNRMFTPATRREVARQFAEEFTVEARLGNLTENPGSSVQYEVDLSKPSHIEEVKLRDDKNLDPFGKPFVVGVGTLYRFGQPITSFTVDSAQKKRILSRKGELRITSDMIRKADDLRRLGNLTENPRVSGGRQNPSSVKYEADLSAPSHIEEVRLSGNTATLYRFGRPVVSFTPSPAQKKKIASGKGKLRITSDMVTTGHGYPGLQKRNPITQADHTPFGWKEEPAQPELLEREDGLGLTLPLARSTLNLLAAYNDGEAPTLKPEEVFKNINYNNKFDVLGLYEGTYAQDIGSLVTFSQDGSGPVAEYLNVGDPYIPTVLYDYEQDQFYITGWGDWLAKWEEEHGADHEDW